MTRDVLLFVFGLGVGISGTLLCFKTFFRVDVVNESWECQVFSEDNKKFNLVIQEMASGRSWKLYWDWNEEDPTGWPVDAPELWSATVISDLRRVIKERLGK